MYLQIWRNFPFKGCNYWSCIDYKQYMKRASNTLTLASLEFMFLASLLKIGHVFHSRICEKLFFFSWDNSSTYFNILFFPSRRKKNKRRNNCSHACARVLTTGSNKLTLFTWKADHEPYPIVHERGLSH